MSPTEPGTSLPLGAVDLLLGQGTPAELKVVRAHVQEDVGFAVEVAEARELLDRMRGLEVTPSEQFALRLRNLVDLAGRRRQWWRIESSLRPLLWLGAAAAALALVVLATRDPLGMAPKSAVPQVAQARPVAPPEPEPAPVRAARDTAAVLAAVRAQLQAHDPEAPLLRALDQFADRSQVDPLSSWVHAKKSLAELRLESELRTSTELRCRALRDRGGNPDIDNRVQALAASIATQIDTGLEAGRLGATEVTLALRALMAAGCQPKVGAYAAELRASATWLRDRVQDTVQPLPVADQASALAALADLAAGAGEGVAFVGWHTQRLLQANMTEAAWTGGPPPLLAADVPVAALADCGRLLTLAPAFGVDPGLAFATRVVIAAELEVRRLHDGGGDPAVVAAELYGFADLLEREVLDRKLAGVGVALLNPDFETLHRVTWSRPPGSAGITQRQHDLESLAFVPTPVAPRDQAALLLALATNFAAPGLSNLRTLGD